MENIEENEIINKNDDIQPLYDYYDRYYENVLSTLNTINDNQKTIIVKQENIISESKTSNNFLGCCLFMICLFFIYYVLRKMILVK